MVSGEEPGICGENDGAATSQENREAAAACSNVASSATLTEILQAADDAIAAIEDGDVEIAKARLRAILTERHLRNGQVGEEVGATAETAGIHPIPDGPSVSLGCTLELVPG